MKDETIFVAWIMSFMLFNVMVSFYSQIISFVLTILFMAFILRNMLYYGPAMA